MFRLHVCTAVTRPHNLPAIEASLRRWGPHADFEWHIRFDLAKRHIGGQAVKNAMLDSIADGWVWFLDDDTIAHPRFYRAVSAHATGTAVVVSQSRADGRTLTAAPENAVVNEIDIGQAVLRRDLIGDHRIPEEYAGDGYFLQSVLGPDTVFMDEVLSFHNRLEVVGR